MFTEEQVSVFAITAAVLIPISYCYFLFKRKYGASQTQLEAMTPARLSPTPPSTPINQFLTPKDHAELRREHLSLVAQSMESKQREVDLYFMTREMRDSQTRAEESRRQMEELNARILAERVNRNPWHTPPPPLNFSPTAGPEHGQRKRGGMSLMENLQGLLR